MATRVDNNDVVRLFLQFCKENSLHETFQTLQRECQVSLNAVDNLENFIADIKSGRWDAVLHQLSQLEQPTNLLQDLYEQIVLEMVQLEERDTARDLLCQTQVLRAMKTAQPNDSRDLNEHSSNEKRRAEIARALSYHVSSFPPSRLKCLIGEALLWYSQHHLLLFETKFDFLRGRPAIIQDSEDTCPTRLVHSIDFAKYCHPLCCRFSPDGQFLVSGSADGYIYVWNPTKGELVQFEYLQADIEFMTHDGVQCLDFSKNSQMLATGSKDGSVKAWSMYTGCKSVSFSRTGAYVLTASLDGTARIHDFLTVKLLKEFRGHTSFVNDARFSKDDSLVITASSDSTVKVWDACSTKCLRTFKWDGATVNSIHLFPSTLDDHILVCNKTSSVYIMTLQGQVVKSFSSDKREGGDFVAACVSCKGDYIYCLGEDRKLYCFSYQSGELEHLLPVQEVEDVIGIAHHPHRNLVATFGQDCFIKLWKP
ncbi:OLC1v1000840C1 [Oldenlandia corymbosa var. corymbosa]|uniref:OLC1v1000840C1 n=1 Tax=Oldenlandia corymbosa var. corymbosa TaxID=529605 RepID=A0AAV1D3Q6_OLDCO|nr:OLC1v1000840C1 [Oldenlandia corymbosa var. corymbosa]